MRWVSRQRALKAAVGAVVVTVGIVSAGCDAKEADRKAMEQFDRGDYKAAAKGAESPSIQALAASRAVDQSLAAALPTYRDLTFSQLRVADTLFSLNRMAAQADSVSSSSQALAKLNPQAALSSIDTTVQQVKGDGAPAWAPTGTDVQMPTISATSARANQLKDQIAEIERNQSALKQKRDAAAADSLRFLDESRAAKGEKSVQLYKQSADAKQKASDLAVQMEQVDASLVPLKQELAIVQEQNQLAGQTLEVLTGQRENIEKSWRGIQAQADQRTALVSGIFGKDGADKSASIMGQAAKLAELSAEQGKLATQYQEQLQGASALAKDAVSSSEKAVKAVGLQGGSSKGATPVDLLKLALDPSAARFTQACIDLSLGSSQGTQAALLSSQARVLSNIADIAKRVNQKMPDGMDPDAIKKLQDVSATAGTETLKGATDRFGVVSEARTSTDTKQSATVGQMLALDASAMLFQTQGDAANAKQSLDQAKALRDKLLEGGAKFPSLPDSLQGGAPAPAAAPGAVEKQ